jgi:hypothetical protein
MILAKVLTLISPDSIIHLEVGVKYLKSLALILAASTQSHLLINLLY